MLEQRRASGREPRRGPGGASTMRSWPPGSCPLGNLGKTASHELSRQKSQKWAGEGVSTCVWKCLCGLGLRGTPVSCMGRATPLSSQSSRGAPCPMDEHWKSQRLPDRLPRPISARTLRGLYNIPNSQSSVLLRVPSRSDGLPHAN